MRVQESRSWVPGVTVCCPAKLPANLSDLFMRPRPKVDFRHRPARNKPMNNSANQNMPQVQDQSLDLLTGSPECSTVLRLPPNE